MILVKIYALEDIEEANVVLSLSEGDHIIGRDTILNCNDKRVSRKHAVIIVNKFTVAIKPVHVNPCFWRGVNSFGIIVLAKDSSVVLGDGDQFALLADAFWFRVRVFKNDGNEAIAKNSTTQFWKSASNWNKVTAINEKCNDTYTSTSEVTALNVPTDVDKIPSTSKRSIVENLGEEVCKRQKISDKNEQSEPNMNTSDRNICSDENLSSRPTSSAEPLLNTSQNILNASSTREENLLENIDSDKLIQNLKTIIEEDYGNGSEKHKKDKEISVTKNDVTHNLELNNTADNNSVKIKQEIPDESIEVKQEKLPDSEAEKDNNEGENHNLVEIKQEIADESIKEKQEKVQDSEATKDNNEGENHNLVEIKQETPNESIKGKQEKVPDSEAEKYNEGENSNLNNTHIEVKTEENEEPIPKTSDIEQAEGSSSNTKNSQNDEPTCSTNNQNKKTRRERCWYGVGCYRKNPAHRAQFRHPGDDDYDSDPDDDRPVCPYGVACYRRNVEHRKQYLHINPPGPKPNNGDGHPRKKQKAPKKKTKPSDSGDDQSSDDSNDDGTTSGKRKAAMKKTYYDSPLDDYDYDDPFIDNASSDEFVLSSDDDDDDTTDWDDSQKADEESQETRRLLKEAKRFTKAKGKKKD